MKKPIAGTVYFKMDGGQLELSGSITCSLDMYEREGQSGLSGPVGFIEKPRVPYVEGDFFVPEGFPIEEIKALTEGTITVELANGMNGVLSQAWSAGTIDVNGADGTTPLRFEGLNGEWM